MHISDDVKGTSPDRITGTDVMVAYRCFTSLISCRFRLAAFFGKDPGISKTGAQMASSGAGASRDELLHRRTCAKLQVVVAGGNAGTGAVCLC